MRRTLRLAVMAVMVTIAAAPRDASAQQPEPEPKNVETEPSRRTLLVEGSGGVGTPLGWLGASAVVMPIPSLALHGGVGLGSQSWQISAGARGRIKTSARNFISIGGAWSTGQIAVVDDTWIPSTGYQGNSVWWWDRAHILNLEASFEHDARAVIVRPFVGLGYVLNGGDALLTHELLRQRTCPDCSPGLFARVSPYLGFAVAFGVF